MWWAELDEPRGSEPGFRRPVLIIQADSFNRSQLPTVIAVALSTRMELLEAPGNVLLPGKETGLPKDSVAVVTQVITLDTAYLTEKAGRIPSRIQKQVDRGLGLVLEL